MKHAGLLLTFLLLLALTACSSDKQQQNNYHKFDDLMDNSKPIAFGEERDVFIFAEGQNLERVATVLDSSLAREIQMTVGESLFQPISIDFDQLDEYRKYKNLIFCGTLDGSDSVSAYLRETLASDLVETARASGGELFVVNNLHVRDQIILYLLAKDTPSLEELARQRSDQIFRYLADRFSQRQGYQAYRLSVYGDKFYEDWPFSIQVPVSFRPFKEDKKDGFLSFIHQPANPTRNLPDKYVSVYYEAMPQNSIDEKWLHDKRQELGTKYLNGDEILRYTAEPAQFAGYDALRIYGHWINKELGGGVGGAFQTYAFWHEATQRAYLVDSIVYFPDGEKLPVLLELSMISASIAVK